LLSLNFSSFCIFFIFLLFTAKIEDNLNFKKTGRISFKQLGMSESTISLRFHFFESIKVELPYKALIFALPEIVRQDLFLHSQLINDFNHRIIVGPTDNVTVKWVLNDLKGTLRSECSLQAKFPHLESFIFEKII
jgi:hypothetical protein